ncbi:hypothetical protein KSS87_023600 [Heliosperma pusillum]|nr:hypothetical protein KSS87_023600 [Heliosperma pusillum]
MRATSWSPTMTLPLSKLDVHFYGCSSMTAFPSSPPRLTLQNSLLPNFPYLNRPLSVNSDSRHRLPLPTSASASVSADSIDDRSAVQSWYFSRLRFLDFFFQGRLSYLVKFILSRKAFGNGRDFRFDINAVEIPVLQLFLFMALGPTGSFFSHYNGQILVADMAFLSEIKMEKISQILQVNSDHWRKNVGALGKSHKVYAIDLIGYGYSDKPNPRDFGDTPFYTFRTWASQLNDFCQEVVQDEAFFICNSIGGLVGLEAAVMEPQICRGLLLLNISLRMLHIKKQPALARPLIKSFQSLLRDTALGKYFFKTVATTQSVRNILCQVTDELVEKILLPGLQPGAVDVFLEFICYSDGPLPEELLPQVKVRFASTVLFTRISPCPVLIAWGDKDPWEPIELGRAYGNFETVEDFVVLPDVGHCPQDEAPQLVNPLVESFVARHSTSSRAESSS